MAGLVVGVVVVRVVVVLQMMVPGQVVCGVVGLLIFVRLVVVRQMMKVDVRWIVEIVGGIV